LRHLAHSGRCGACQAELPPTSQPIELDTATFDALTAESKTPLLVDFWAAWCGPCRMMAPELEKVAEARAGSLLVGKVDTDRYPELAARYSVEALPTLVLFDGAEERKRLSGARPAAVILRELAL
jgi:thioredoxin 2